MRRPAALSKDGRFAKKPAAAIVVFGEDPYAEFEGDRENLEFSPNDKHDLALLRRLHAQVIPTVAVFLSGRPMWVDPEINAADAFVLAWLPGSEGEGVADLLFSKLGRATFDFTGRLAFSWPQSAMRYASMPPQMYPERSFPEDRVSTIAAVSHRRCCRRIQA